VFESGGVMGTVGRWPWRLASAKKRVTTYLPNLVLEKMEGKESVDETCLAICFECQVRGRGRSVEGLA